MEFAFVFPGQGSQAVGMVNDFSESFPIVKECFEEASETIKVDLWKLVQQGPEADLNQTSNTQPAMLAASFSIWKIWESSVSTPATAMAGHSFGEVSAFTSAGALSFAKAVQLARTRGELMQNAVPDGTGAMAAILGLADDEITQLCQSISSEDHRVEAVNFNSPGQVVVAGHSAAVDQLIDQAKEQGAKRALKLPVSVPAHSGLMKPAAEKFGQALSEIEFTLPKVQVLQNATLKSPQTVDDLVQGLQAQLYSPVQWVKTVESLAQQNIGCLLELGPGKVLTGLNKRINKSLTSLCVYDNKSLETAIKAIEE
ncbi:MAG: ACP S-malonyltransferase [Pseudomonadota bacterium]